MGASRACILEPDRSIDVRTSVFVEGEVKLAGAPVGISSSNDELEPFPTLNQSGSPSHDMYKTCKKSTAGGQTNVLL